MAAAGSFFDSSQGGASISWAAWCALWPKTAADYTNVAITPGADETKLNFAWYSKAGTSAPVVYFGSDAASPKEFRGTSAAVSTALTGSAKYVYNHVTVSGLRENTTYCYAVAKNGAVTPQREYRTGSFSDLHILFVSDPQIGASSWQTQNGQTLRDAPGVDNSAARNDGYSWLRTLETAAGQDPALNFMLSAGDQVDKFSSPREEEYAAYLSPPTLSWLAQAPAVGNHDSPAADFSYHFFVPNMTRYGRTKAGGDYYFSCGPGLFIVLNTNNTDAAGHEKAIAEAVRHAPEAAWRLVVMHQDLYGSGFYHSNSDSVILRTQLTPIFGKYKIDVVLQGHDHCYSRSLLLRGDGAPHSSYEYRRPPKNSPYGWNQAYNKDTGAYIPLSRKKLDAAGAAAKSAFDSDNRCYLISDPDASAVTDPHCILYVTANSASGSKFYKLAAARQDYIAQRSQNHLPGYSMLRITSSDFSIDTYQIAPDGRPEKIDETFTIHKTKQHKPGPN